MRADSGACVEKINTNSNNKGDAWGIRRGIMKQIIVVLSQDIAGWSFAGLIVLTAMYYFFLHLI